MLKLLLFLIIIFLVFAAPLRLNQLRTDLNNEKITKATYDKKFNQLAWPHLFLLSFSLFIYFSVVYFNVDDRFFNKSEMMVIKISFILLYLFSISPALILAFEMVEPNNLFILANITISLAPVLKFMDSFFLL